MLDITTNNQTNLNYNGYGIVDSGSLLDEDMMDPLFDEDWLHENNLDILFDLFEEEIESKCVETNNGSSSIFGTSPVTYLFGTSPSLASTLDLLCFDNQQPQQLNNSALQTTSSASASVDTPSTNNVNVSNINSIMNNQHNNKLDKSVGSISSTKDNNVNFNSMQQVNQIRTSSVNQVPNSITNAMRIKRGLRKGQSEGVSLLAKPHTSNGSKDSSSSYCTSNSRGYSSNNINISSISDKTSATLTNLKRSIIGKDNSKGRSSGLDINYSEQNKSQNRIRHIHHCHHHVHYITGGAVIREHAYAVPGH